MQIIDLNMIPRRISPIVHCSQMDVGREFQFKLYDGEEEYTIPSGSTVGVEGMKSDKHGFTYNSVDNPTVVKYSGSTVNIYTTEQMTAAAGIARCEIKITSGSMVLYSINYNLDVETMALPSDSDISASDIPMIKQAIEAGNTAQSKVDEAAASAKAAASSASNAKTAETNASASATKAATSESNAKTSETNAATSAKAAATSATNAKTSETNAKASQTAAATSEKNAKASETSAASSATAATNSATAAATSASTASSKATAAANSATAAKTSETNAKASQTAAATSATNAKTSETNAKTSQTAAATSATSASNYAKTAQSWAVGGTSSRTGEDTNNSKYYAEQAQKSADAASNVVASKLPVASKNALGGVKIGDNISVDAGTISVTGDDVGNAIGVRLASWGLACASDGAIGSGWGEILRLESTSNYQDTNITLLLTQSFKCTNSIVNVRTNGSDKATFDNPVIRIFDLEQYSTKVGYVLSEDAKTLSIYAKIEGKWSGIRCTILGESHRASRSACKVTKIETTLTADSTKPDGLVEGTVIGTYTLPAATSSVLGGVKTGSNITNNSGTISITGNNVATALGYTPHNPYVAFVGNNTGTSTQWFKFMRWSTDYTKTNCNLLLVIQSSYEQNQAGILNVIMRRNNDTGASKYIITRCEWIARTNRNIGVTGVIEDDGITWYIATSAQYEHVKISSILEGGVATLNISGLTMYNSTTAETTEPTGTSPTISAIARYDANGNEITGTYQPKLTIDTALSASSTNPVQNKAIVNGGATILNALSTSTTALTDTDTAIVGTTKRAMSLVWTYIQNKISSVLGITKATFDAKSNKSDTVKSLSISGKTITVTNGDGTTSTLTTQDTTYTLPTATSSVLGGVKTGSNITNSSGTISITKANVTSALGYTPPTTNTTYSVATSSANGLMSAADKKNHDAMYTEVNARPSTRKLATQSLTADGGTLTFTDSSIGDDSLIDVYASIPNIAPSAITQSGTTVTVKFDAQDSAFDVALVIYN